MIAKLEPLHKTDQTHTQNIYNESNNKQRINNIIIAALGRTVNDFTGEIVNLL